MIIEEDKFDYKRALKEIKEKHPEVLQIVVSYQGSGDSFDGFWNTDIVLKDSTTTTLSENSYEDILWYAIVHSDADFNNDGCEGNIVIDLENLTLSIDNYYIVHESEPSGKIVFD